MNNDNKLGIIVLAAGLGKRMKSALPKVLHCLCDKPMLSYVIENVKKLAPAKTCFVLGHQWEKVRKIIPSNGDVVLQKKLLGTGDAVRQCGKTFKNFQGEILVLCGDVPLLSLRTLRRLLKTHRQSGAAVTIVTATVAEPAGYGRIVRNSSGKTVAIVEEKDASPAEKKIREINSGIYCFNAELLFAALRGVRNDNRQGEYYLTDVVAITAARGLKIETVRVRDVMEITGINSRMQLHDMQKTLFARTADSFLQQGVTLYDAATTYIGPDVKIGRDVEIYPNVYITGSSRIKDMCRIGPNTVIKNSTIGSGVTLTAAVLDSARIPDRAAIASFSTVSGRQDKK